MSGMIDRLFAQFIGGFRVAENILMAVGEDITPAGLPCTQYEVATKRWVRGGPGVADVEYVCLKDSSNAYSWTTTASGGTVGLAAHIADTAEHGATGAVVGTTNTQTLTNKTLTSPAITTPTGLVKGDVGLGNVDNTSDTTKNSATVTLTNKTLTTPTIADLTNAQHGHTTATSGGNLSAAATTSGVFATARLGSGTADSLVFLRGDQTWNSLPLKPGAWPSFFIDDFGSNGTGNGQFTTIRGMTVTRDSEVYVSSDDRIQKFSTNGTYIATLATAGTGNGQVNDPAGLWYNAYADTLWVADQLNDRFQIFTSADAFDSKFGTAGSGNGQFADPLGVAIYPGSLFTYVSDTGNHRVQRIHALSGYDSQWGSFGTGTSQFNSPTGIATDAQQRVWVVDSGNHRVQVFTAAGAFIFTFGSNGTGDGQFSSPHSIALDGQGNAYVTDTGNDRVQVFDRYGVFQGAFGESGSGTGQMDGPTAIAVAPEYVYIADNGNSRVLIFSNPAARTRNDGMFVPVVGWTGAAFHTWTNMPAAVTELFGLTVHRPKVDLTGMTELKLSAIIGVAGAAGSTIRVQYSTDTTAWADAGTGTDDEIPLNPGGYVNGIWTNLVAAARTDVWLRVVGVGGNAVADPLIYAVSMQVR